MRLPLLSKMRMILLVIVAAVVLMISSSTAAEDSNEITNVGNNNILRETPLLEEIQDQVIYEPTTMIQVDPRTTAWKNTLDVINFNATTTKTTTTNTTTTPPSTITTPPPPTTKAFCHLITMNNYNARGPFLQFALEGLAAVELAVEHLNTGNGTVISEVAGLNQRCNGIKFTAEHFDTKGVENNAVDQLIPILQRQRGDGTSTTSTAGGGGPPAGGPPSGRPQRRLHAVDSDKPMPCAFIGPFYSQVAVATALYTSLKGYPQFAPIVTAIELDNKANFPLFGRLVPPSASFASPLLELLTGKLGVNHMAVLHSDAVTDLTYVNGIRETIQQEYAETNFQLKSFSFNLAGRSGLGSEDYAATIAALKQTGYRYIFFILSIDHSMDVLQEAYNQGIIGPNSGYVWISASINSLQSIFNPKDPTLQFLPDSFEAQIGGGMLSYDVTRQATLPGYGNYDLFQKAWKDLALYPKDLEYLESKLPTSVAAVGKARNKTYYSPQTFARGFDASAVFYDVTIALGLAACNSQPQPNDTTTTTPLPPPQLTGPQHYQHMLNTTMEGASGPIRLDPKTGSRDPRSIYYQITNLLPHTLENGNVTYKDAKVFFFDGENEWISLTDIQYSDNTTDGQPPLDLPPQEIYTNPIGLGLRVVGLTLSGIVILSSIGLVIWTIENKQSRIVMASQPIFLYIICFGTLLMGASIIPKSLDDQVVSAEGATVACATFPWLLSMGWCFAFSALFSKTYRINKIFHNPSFKRVKIEPQDVMVPMLSLLAANILILSLWTGLDHSLVWERYVVGYDIFGRPNETRGHCTSDHWLPYMLSLGVVNIGALVVALYQAWIARKISLEFAESEWIARVMNTILLVAFVGGPVLVIADEDPSAFYFVFSALIFVICMSLLVFIFGPKIAKTRSMVNNKRSSKGAIQETLGNMKKTSMSRNSDGRYSDGRTESDPMDISAHSYGSNVSGDNDPHRPSTGAEGAKVLMHPALEKEKREEMRALKKEKKKLRNMIAVLQSKVPGFGIDDAEKNGLLADNQNLEEQLQEQSQQFRENQQQLQEYQKKLDESYQQLQEETQHLEEDKLQLQDDLMQLEKQLVKQHHQQEQEKQQLQEDLKQAREELEKQNRQQDEEKQQLQEDLRQAREELEKQQHLQEQEKEQSRGELRQSKGRLSIRHSQKKDPEKEKLQEELSQIRDELSKGQQRDQQVIQTLAEEIRQLQHQLQQKTQQVEDEKTRSTSRIKELEDQLNRLDGTQSNRLNPATDC